MAGMTMKRTERILFVLALAAITVLACFRYYYWYSTRNLTPGSVIPEQTFNWVMTDHFFQVHEIPDTIFELMQGKSYKENCTVPREDLRYLLLLHRNIEGQAMVGEMVVNKAIADDVIEIMQELFLAAYPIEKMRLVDYYDADDEKSMTDNNSSAFNWRYIKGSTKLSNHSTGMAVDINPLYNPYYLSRRGRETIQPQSGKPYLDRTSDYPYKMEVGDLCYELFSSHGFIWGGDWESPKDYQHFEKPSL